MNHAGYEIRETLSGQTFRCLPDQSVLSAMEQQGKRCVPVGCRGGGCGLCKVRVMAGEVARTMPTDCPVTETEPLSHIPTDEKALPSSA